MICAVLYLKPRCHPYAEYKLNNFLHKFCIWMAILCIIRQTVHKPTSYYVFLFQWNFTVRRWTLWSQVCIVYILYLPNCKLLSKVGVWKAFACLICCALNLNPQLNVPFRYLSSDALFSVLKFLSYSLIFLFSYSIRFLTRYSSAVHCTASLASLSSIVFVYRFVICRQ